MGKIKKWFKGLSPVMQIVVILSVIVVAWMIFKRASGYFSQLSKEQMQQGEKDALEAQGITLTYPLQDYKALADDLYNAMAGAGTDTKTVFNTFNKMENDLDVIQLDQDFGFRDTLFSSPTNLQGWLKDDLSTAEMQQLNDTLRNKGITKTY